MQPTNRIAHALNGNNGTASKPAPGRDGQGRFTKGNPGGPGNPFTRQIAGFRRALCNAVTEQDIQDLAQILLAKAKAGDLLAIKLLLLYTVGRPAEVADPDRLDAQEMQLYRMSNADEETMAELLRGTPADFALTMLRTALPCRTQVLAEYTLEQLNAADSKPASTEAEPPSPSPAETAAPMTNGANGKAREEPASSPLAAAKPERGTSPAPMTNGGDGIPVEEKGSIVSNGMTAPQSDSSISSPASRPAVLPQFTLTPNQPIGTFPSG